MKLQVLEDTNELKIQEIILDTANKKNQVIYGARAINRQLPVPLRKQTTDYDILTKNPKKSAKELIEEIKPYTSKQLTIEKAKHKGTYKVKLDGKTIVDYTQIPSKIKTKRSWGNKLKDIKSIKRGLQKTTKRGDFRKDKDLDTLNRIKRMEQMFNNF